jgi:hypothetical protein
MVGEASRANGAKGGRPKETARGQLPPEEYEARKRARKSLQERCQQNELEFVETLEVIARDLTQPANARIGAIGMIFDRARGKAAQPHDGDGLGGPIVVTGVPEPDGEPTAPYEPKPDRLIVDRTETILLGSVSSRPLPKTGKNLGAPFWRMLKCNGCSLGGKDTSRL